MIGAFLIQIGDDEVNFILVRRRRLEDTTAADADVSSSDGGGGEGAEEVGEGEPEEDGLEGLSLEVEEREGKKIRSQLLYKFPNFNHNPQFLGFLRILSN